MDTRILELLIDSFPKLLIPGLTMTIPLTVVSFCFAMVIAVVVAMVQFAHVGAQGFVGFTSGLFAVHLCLCSCSWCFMV